MKRVFENILVSKQSLETSMAARFGAAGESTAKVLILWNSAVSTKPFLNPAMNRTLTRPPDLAI